MEQMQESENRYLLRDLNMPPEVHMNEKLDKTCIRLFLTITCLDHTIKHCWASNEYLAAILNVAKVTISKSVSTLIKEKYIEQLSFDGRTRVLRISPNFRNEYKHLVEETDYRMDTYKKSKPTRQCSVNSSDKEYKDKDYNRSLFLDPKDPVSRKTDSIPSECVTLASSSSVNKPKLNKRQLSKSQTIRNKAKLVDHPLHPLPHVAITPPVQEVLEHWHELKLYESKEATKTYRDGVKKLKGLLNGKLFGVQYTIDDIKNSITNFSFAALDNDFEPSGPYKKTLQKMNIAAFILSEHSTNDDKSKFKKYFSTMPAVARSKELLPDDSPLFTSELKSFYVNSVLGGVQIKFPAKDENNFRKAAIKFNEFCETNYNKIRGHIDDAEGARYLFESIEKDKNGDVKSITPGWFCSNETWTRRFPAYLNFQGMLLNGESEYFDMYSWKAEDDVSINMSN